MNFYHDRQIKGYCCFIIIFVTLIFLVFLMSGANLTASAKNMYLRHEGAVATSLLEQGVSEEVIAAALTSERADERGEKLLAMAGITEQSGNFLMPFLYRFQRQAVRNACLAALSLSVLLSGGTFLFLECRRRLYRSAETVVNGYLAGDFSMHLNQSGEGAVYQLFARVENLAAMLRARGETEYKTKEFLKNTISDISHQLKTPLAALAMYQEIMEDEPDNVDTVKMFTGKMGTAIRRMESLIQLMLKITRLDAGYIDFEKRSYFVSEVILHSIHELSTRAEAESKKIVVNGEEKIQLICDMEWTGEAIENIVKNALDHTGPGDTIQITWEQTPAMVRIFISDHGSGIAPEDIHHIFKRFYRSKHTSATEGIGLGLPLAKAIVEGQGGIISVQSNLNEGTTFILSFLTEM